MLEKPAIEDASIHAALRNDFNLAVRQIDFLPLGADLNTAVYRATTAEGAAYFVKLRTGAFNEITVTLPAYLAAQGIRQIVPPLSTKDGRHWSAFNAGALLLYPFVTARNGYEVDLSAQHWTQFGAAVKEIHTLELPPALRLRIPTETYTLRWPQTVRSFLARVTVETFHEPVAAELAAFLRTQKPMLRDLVEQTEQLAQVLRTQSPTHVLCHADLHAGNILIGADGAFYIVDWDNPILAPKERDLMYVGGAQGFRGHAPAEEEQLFYQGYGATPIDARALAYYRFARIVEDISIYCEQLLLSDAGGADRAESLHYLRSNFQAGGTIERAYAASHLIPAHHVTAAPQSCPAR